MPKSRTYGIILCDQTGRSGGSAEFEALALMQFAKCLRSLQDQLGRHFWFGFSDRVGLVSVTELVLFLSGAIKISLAKSACILCKS